MLLTRDQILACRLELPRETVNVPELGGDVTIRVLTLAEVHEIQRAQKASADPLDLYPKLVALTLVGEDGRQFFVGQDIELVKGLPWPAVDTIAKAALKLNKMSKEEEEKDKAPKA